MLLTMSRIFLFTMVFGLLLLGCSKGDGSLAISIGPTASGGSTKPLFSLWQEENGYYQLDLRTAAFATQSNVVITLVTGQNCTCSALFLGDESSGTVSLSSCSGTYPSCGSFVVTGTYTKTANLEICASSSSCTNLN